MYLNGVLAYRARGYISSYETRPLRDPARQALVLGGQNTLAVHVHQTTGGQYVDVGLSERIPPTR